MGRSFIHTLAKAGLVSCLVSLLYLGLIQPLKLFAVPVLRSQDLFFVMRHLLPYHNPALDEIFLVEVDDESIEKIHERWPFRRRIYAELLQKLEEGAPKLIALDFIFAGKGEPMDDFLLAEALQKSGNVVLAAFVDNEGNYVTSLKEIRDAARGSGVVNKLQDRDFSVRRAHLDYRDQTGKVVGWSWEVEILSQLLKLDKEKFKVGPKGVEFASLEGGKVFIPLQTSREAVINYRVRLEDLTAMPLWKLLEDKELPEKVRGRIVVAGATSKVLHDYYHTPLGMMPGVVININYLINMVTQDYLKKIPVAVSVLFLVLMAGAAAVLALRYNVLQGLAGLGGCSFLVVAVFFGLFCRNFCGDYFTPLAGGWFVFLIITIYRYFHTFLENTKLRGEVATDPLTGLYNRRFLESRIDSELAKLISEKRGRKTDPFHELSVLMIDIDNFKKINDTYGHQFGDDVIKNVSYCVRESTRQDDVVARFGGEEFCVVLVHTSKEEASQIAEKIRKSVEAKKLNYVSQVTSFTISLGVAAAKADQLLSSRALIRAADEALYQAKRTGKNKVCLYEQGHAS